MTDDDLRRNALEALAELEERGPATKARSQRRRHVERVLPMIYDMRRCGMTWERVAIAIGTEEFGFTGAMLSRIVQRVETARRS